MSVITMDKESIEGHECILRNLNPGADSDAWQVILWYRPVREFVFVATEPTRQQAIESARSILADRERFGCLLMAEGTRRLNEAGVKEERRAADRIRSVTEAVNDPERGPQNAELLERRLGEAEPC